MPPAKKASEGKRAPIGAPKPQSAGQVSNRSAKGPKKPKDTVAKVKKEVAKGKEGAPLSTAAIKDAFKALDADGSGTLDRQELSAWLHKQEQLGGPAVRDFVPRMVARLREEATDGERDVGDEAAARREARRDVRSQSAL